MRYFMRTIVDALLPFVIKQQRLIISIVPLWEARKEWQDACNSHEHI